MENHNSRKNNLLIGCTGSVATVRIVQLIEAFKEKYNLKIILTDKAKIFADKMILNYEEYEKENNVDFYFDEDEFKEYRDYDKVLHIETCVIRAWDFSKPGFFALAMNTFMYENFLTEKQIKIMKEEFKFVHIPSVVKKLKCGDTGMGGIADTKDILDIVNKHFESVKEITTK